MKQTSRIRIIITLLGALLLLGLLLPGIAAAMDIELAEYRPPSAGILGPGESDSLFGMDAEPATETTAPSVPETVPETPVASIDYASLWTGEWILAEDQQSFLSIMPGEDGKLHMLAMFNQMIGVEADFTPLDGRVIIFRSEDFGGSLVRSGNDSVIMTIGNGIGMQPDEPFYEFFLNKPFVFTRDGQLDMTADVIKNHWASELLISDQDYSTTGKPDEKFPVSETLSFNQYGQLSSWYSYEATEFGHRSISGGSSYAYVYDYDKSGHQIRNAYYSYGVIENETENAYDDDGKQVLSHKAVYSDSEVRHNYRYYEYDTDKRLISIRLAEELGGQSAVETAYEYAEDGSYKETNYIVKKNYDVYVGLITWYDSNKRETRRVYYDENGTVNQEDNYEYKLNGEGNIVRETQKTNYNYTSDRGSFTLITEYGYDENGKQSSKRQWTEGQPGVVTHVWVRDESNHVIYEYEKTESEDGKIGFADITEYDLSPTNGRTLCTRSYSDSEYFGREAQEISFTLSEGDQGTKVGISPLPVAKGEAAYSFSMDTLKNNIRNMTREAITRSPSIQQVSDCFYDSDAAFDFYGYNGAIRFVFNGKTSNRLESIWWVCRDDSVSGEEIHALLEMNGVDWNGGFTEKAGYMLGVKTEEGRFEDGRVTLTEVNYNEERIVYLCFRFTWSGREEGLLYPWEMYPDDLRTSDVQMMDEQTDDSVDKETAEVADEQERTPIPETPVTMAPTATPIAEPVVSPVNADSNILVDDDLLTIVNLGKEIQTSSFLTAGKYVCYILSVTNHMDYDIRIQSGKSDRYWESGSVDGVELLLLNLVGKSNPPYIRAGETIEVEMAPIGYGYGYQDVDEMVNVIVNINVQNANGETLRDYTLRLDEGQSYQRRQATGNVVHEAQPYGFTYELPDDWKIKTETIENVEYYGEFWIEPQKRPWMFTYIYLLSPPTLNGGILIEGIPPQVVLTEEDDESIVRKPNIMVDGCLTEVFEYAGQEWYYIRTDAGVIRIYGETPHSQKMREVFDRFIKSIRFTDRVPGFPATDEPAVTLTPTPTAEPTTTPVVEITATPTTEPTATPTPEPTATPTPTPEPTATPTAEPIAVTAEPEQEAADFTEFWVGAWMTNDDVPAEMAITPNEDGTLHLKMRFLWDVELETELNPTNNRLLRFVIGDNMYTGIITRQDDGTMNLYFDGGYMLEDDESELEIYLNHNEFFFHTVNPEKLWNDADTVNLDITEWLGTWKASGSGHESTLIIMDDGAGGLNMFMTLDNRITITSALEPYAGGMDFDSGDVNGSLTLNRELHVIRMTDVGSTSDDVNNWMDNFGMMVEYRIPGGNTGSAAPETTTVTEVYEQPAVNLFPIAGTQDVMQVPILYADATSWIEGSSDPTAYAPFRMIDGEETTAFQVSTKTTKLGQIYLYYNFMAPVTVDELWIKNGFWKTTDGKDQYTRNSRIKAMTVDFCYENSGEYRDEIKVTLKDDKKRKDWQTVKLDGKRNVTSVRICVKSIYEGSKFKTDVCVSEVMFVQKTGN